jgi:hypothetical protein
MDPLLRRYLWIVLVVALSARAGWGTWRMVRASDAAALEFPDEEQYWHMARSLRTGGGLVDELGFRATRMPLYPGWLALFAGGPNGVIAAKAVQWGIGAVGAVFAALLGAALFDRRVGLLAGLWYALDPFLVFLSSLLLTETLFTTLLTATWWAGWRAAMTGGEHPSRSRWLLLAVLAATVVYARESTLGLIVLLAGYAAVRRRFQRPALVGWAGVLLTVVAALVPWAVRNHAVLGEWCWLTTRSGISLYDGVRPGATGASDLGDVKQMPEVAGLDEASWNRYFVRASFDAMSDEPGRVLRLAGVKLARMWNPLPNVETYRGGATQWISAAWIIPTFVLAVCGTASVLLGRGAGRWAVAAYLLLPAVYFSFLHSLFVGSVRYRLGAMPMIGVLASAGLIRVFAALWRRNETHNGHSPSRRPWQGAEER